MTALFIMLAAIAVSMLINRIATIALRLTGLSKEMAEFQARSVITGTGFTTNESENIVQHPARRRIVKLTMLVQSAGLITVISTFILSFIGTASAEQAFERGVILIIGLLVLVFLSQNKVVERRLERIIKRMLTRYANLEVKDYHMLLDVDEGYMVNRFTIEENSWLANKALAEMELLREGVIVLSIHRNDGSIAGAPRGSYALRPGDTITVYGKSDVLRELSERAEGADGDTAHERAVEEHEEDKREADRRERAREAAWAEDRERHNVTP